MDSHAANTLTPLPGAIAPELGAANERLASVAQPMRILVYGLNFAPELTGVGKYTGEMVSWLTARGHEVRVVSGYPYYPDWRVQDSYRPWRYAKETLLGAAVWRCPLWVPRRPSGATRLLHLASFAAASVPVLLLQARWTPHVVITIAPTMFCAIGGWSLTRAANALGLLHVQDFEVDAAFELGVLRKPRLHRLFRRIETWLFQRFDRVTAISPRMVQRLVAKGVESKRTGLLTNWVDCEAIRPTSTPNPYRAQLGLPEDVKVALYSGAIGQKQGFETLIETAKRLTHRDDLAFVFASAGTARAKYQEMTRDLGNVRWMNLQPEDRLNDWLNFADIHLLPQRAGAADLVMPSKLMGMLASGRPVVAMAAPDTQLAEAVSGCGRAVTPESAAEFTAALVELADNAELRADLGRAARQRALEHYERGAVLARLETMLQTGLKERATERRMKQRTS